MANEIRCSLCGEKCLDTDSYCRNCHASLKKQEKIDDGSLEGIDIELWKKFIDNKSSEYINAFKKNEGRSIFPYFNLMALLLPGEWMLYRKLYVPFIAKELTGYLIIAIIVLLFKVNPPLSIIFGFLMAVAYRFALCFFAHAIYKAHIKREISKPYPNFSRGGTSMGVAVGVPIAIYILGALIGMLL